jgi:methylenetetrahydrofolate--tRNA-(uracil-5-)-methyltransferase
MNVNFGLFPPVDKPVRAPGAPRMRGAAKAIAKKNAITARAKADLVAWSSGAQRDAAE